LSNLREDDAESEIRDWD